MSKVKLGAGARNVRKFRTGGSVDLGAGGHGTASLYNTGSGSDGGQALIDAAVIYGAYRYGKKKGREEKATSEGEDTSKGKDKSEGKDKRRRSGRKGRGK